MADRKFKILSDLHVFKDNGVLRANAFMAQSPELELGEILRRVEADNYVFCDVTPIGRETTADGYVFTCMCKRVEPRHFAITGIRQRFDYVKGGFAGKAYFDPVVIRGPGLAMHKTMKVLRIDNAVLRGVTPIAQADGRPTDEFLCRIAACDLDTEPRSRTDKSWKRLKGTK